MPENKKCLIYTRTHALTQNDSLEQQKEYLRQYAEEQGYTVVGEAADLSSVQAAAQSHSFDVLAVTAMSQIGRDMESVRSVLDGLSASGQTIHAVKEGIVAPTIYNAIAVIAAAFQDIESGSEAPEDAESPIAEQEEDHKLTMI